MSSDNEFEKKLNELRRKAEARLSDSDSAIASEAADETRRLLHDLHVHHIELEVQNEELREAQRELERSRDRYLELYHNAPVGYVVTDSAGIILQVNKTFGHLLDQELASMLHKPLAHMIQADDRKIFFSRFRAFYNNPSGKRMEVGMTCRNGEVVFTELEGRRMKQSGQTPDSGPADWLLITINDITQRKTAEQAIIRAKTQWEQTFDAVPDLIAILNEKAEIVRVNKALAARLGQTPQQCVGNKCYEMLHQSRTRPEGCPHLHFLASGRSVTIEAFSRRLNGYFITTVSPFKADDREARWCIHISHDVTERRKAERELLKLRNLESLGTLAGGLAHDFNNILTAQVGNIELAQLHFGDSVKAHSYLDKALKATFRAKELAGRLLTFAEGGHPLSQPVMLDQLLQETVQSSLSGSNVTCDLRLSAAAEPVVVDEIQIRSAFGNIIDNAREAMPEGGIVSITTRNVEVFMENDDLMAPGRYIRIEIRDQGIGICDDDVEKIFDPYFTTKPMGPQKGMGLGLTISHSIIKRHHGYIAVQCLDGQGTAVTVHLPLNSQPAASGTSVPPSAVVNGIPQPRFLIMDDEKIIWNVVRTMLERINCEADFASSGEEAIHLYERSLRGGNPYAALLLDLTVPHGMGATEVIKRILTINPEAKAAVFSGYNTDPVFVDFQRFGFVGALKKPFRAEELENLALQLLAQF